MTTENTSTAAVTPAINLAPEDAVQRVDTEVYRVLSSRYEYSSDDYYNKAVAGAAARGQAAPPRQLQWAIDWECLTMRWSDNPDKNPVTTRSVNVTDKNGAPATWGDPKNPEPTSDDSFPIQLSKYFAKLGVRIGNDPHIIDNMVFVCEKKTLRAGKTEIKPLVPVAIGQAPPTDFVPRVVTGNAERGTAGNPATAQSVPTGPSADDAFKALAVAMNGKRTGDMTAVALADPIVCQQPEALTAVAAGAPAIEKLGTFGSFSPEGVFTLTA